MNKNEIIIGIGTDIIEIQRIAKAIDKYGQKFLDKLFSKKEQEYCNKYNDAAPRFAARFAAKEAIVKALGTGFGKSISFLDIEIINAPSGQPTVALSKLCSDNFNNPYFHLSIAHCHNYTTATAISYQKISSNENR